MTTTGWNTTEFDTFFNATENNTFGNVLAQVNENNTIHHACNAVQQEKNCTAQELTLI